MCGVDIHQHKHFRECFKMIYPTWQTIWPVQAYRKTTVIQMITHYNIDLQKSISENTTNLEAHELQQQQKKRTANTKTEVTIHLCTTKNWAIEDSKNIPWPDESKFLLQHLNYWCRIWYKQCETVDPSIVSTWYQPFRHLATLLAP